MRFLVSLTPFSESHAPGIVPGALDALLPASHLVVSQHAVCNSCAGAIPSILAPVPADEMRQSPSAPISRAGGCC